ncbi:MAG: TolC family protein [Spirochaetales bacterium]|nr:TolC family protein [Spirochaetales bacterium]
MKRQLVFLLILISTSLLFAAISIEEAEEMMRRNNPDIRSAEEAVVQAGLDLKDSKASFSPTISISGSMTYMSEPLVGPVIMESSDILSQMGLGSYSDMASGYVTLYDGMENTMYMGTLSLTQPLITWGKLGKAVDLYKNILTAQSLRKDDTVAQNKAELRIRVWSMKYLEEMEGLVDEAMALSKELVDMAKSSYENGMILRQDWLEAEISSLEVEVKKAELDDNYSSLMEGLRSLIGDYSVSYSDFILPEDESFLYKYRESNLDDLILAATGEDSNNLKAIKNLIGAYTNQKTIADRSLYGIPDFALQAQLTYSSSRLPLIETGWKQNDNNSLNLSIGFKTTLWDGGKAINDVKRAQSNIRSAESQYDSALSQIRVAVTSNYNGMMKNIANIQYQSEKIQNLEMELENIRIGLSYGQNSVSDEKQKMLEIVEAKSNLLASKIALVQNVYTLDYLVGAEIL